MMASASLFADPVRSAFTEFSCHGSVSWPRAAYSAACSKVSSLSASRAALASMVSTASNLATRSRNTSATGSGILAETLGHSTTAFTMDVSTEVAAAMAEAAAVSIATFIPRCAKSVPNGGNQ